MTTRAEFDYPAWETWLETLPPEVAAELREGMELADWLDKQHEETNHGHSEAERTVRA